MCKQVFQNVVRNLATKGKLPILVVWNTCMLGGPVVQQGIAGACIARNDWAMAGDQAQVSDATNVQDGNRRWRIAEQSRICLLYTSPSPRD